MITVLGSTGFIGSNLINYLKQENIEFYAPSKDYSFELDKKLGHVIYCIGLTSDFRERPLETVEAHVCKLVEVLRNGNFESLLFLSSTRVYARNEFGFEKDSLLVNPNDFSDLYNISKLMGESICLSNNNTKIKIVRLSNVIGNDSKSSNFFTSLIREAVKNKSINLKTSFEDKKDYIHINDVTKMLLKIAIDGSDRLYNLASGKSISHQQIIKEITKSIDCKVNYLNIEVGLKFPEVSIENLKKEFNFIPTDVLDEIPKLVNEIKKEINDTN